MLHQNDYEAWYLHIPDEYLYHVEELNFDVSLLIIGYISYIPAKSLAMQSQVENRY